MSIRRTALIALTAATMLTAGATASAAAEPDTPQVVAFIGDFLPTEVWDEPTGCNALPIGTHVVFNETDAPITVYVDPLCLIPLAPLAKLEPGHSMHVSAVGSFRA
ncbi:hypothetical protein [Actinophytocola sp.]|uniref:hypothetical protein n=1 Tax=Actinophytocola sp. TaxID=1872138 RepID=UPI003D6AE860